MSWSVREFDLDRDAGSIAALVTDCTASPLSEERVRTRAEAWPEKQPVMRLSVDRGGQFAGYLRIGQLAPNPKNSFAMSLFVDKEHRRQGIGDELFKHAVDFASRNRASVIATMTVKSDTDGIEFAANRDFDTVSHLFDSYLDLTAFRYDHHSAAFTRAENNGYRVTTLADFTLDEATKRAVFEMYNEADKDTPGAEYFGLTEWEGFDKEVFGAEDFDPKSVSVAMWGKEFVGYSNVSMNSAAGPGEMFTGFTGVVPSHRGNGLAYAMKVKGIEYCLANDGNRLKTENDTRNEPMLAINRKLGFVEEQGEVIMVKSLEGSE